MANKTKDEEFPLKETLITLTATIAILYSLFSFLDYKADNRRCDFKDSYISCIQEMKRVYYIYPPKSELRVLIRDSFKSDGYLSNEEFEAIENKRIGLAEQRLVKQFN